jgi:hypothetical protein
VSLGSRRIHTHASNERLNHLGYSGGVSRGEDQTKKWEGEGGTRRHRCESSHRK